MGSSSYYDAKSACAAMAGSVRLKRTSTTMLPIGNWSPLSSFAEAGIIPPVKLHRGPSASSFPKEERIATHRAPPSLSLSSALVPFTTRMPSPSNPGFFFVERLRLRRAIYRQQ